MYLACFFLLGFCTVLLRFLSFWNMMLLRNLLLYFRDNVVVLSSRLAIHKKFILNFLTFKMKPTVFLETSELIAQQNEKHI
jgi:hypothetical protein